MKNKKHPPALWAVCFWIILWQLLAMAVNQPIFLASPLEVLKSLFFLLRGKHFYISLFHSTGHVVLGILLATITAVLLGALSGAYPLMEELFSPLMSAIKSIPVVSYIILALICFSSRRISILVSFLVVLPILYANLLTGLREVNPLLCEMAQVYHMRRRDILRYLIVPDVYPIFLTAFRLSCGTAWKAGVAAEVIGASASTIGERIGQTKLYLETAELFAWTACVLLCSVLTEKLFALLINGLFTLSQRYHPRERGSRREAAFRKSRFNDDTSSPNVRNSSHLQREKLQGEERPSQVKKESPSLRLSGISKSFGDTAVLKEYSATFRANEPIALMAPSGAGKTTLFRILTGLETPDAGTIEGLDQSKVRLCFQENRLLPNLDALGNIAVANPGYSLNRLKDLIREAGLEDTLGTPAQNLSGGQKRRVALLRALASEGEILLLDEPFTGLDEERKQDLLSLTKRETKGKIVVMASHSPEEARALGARIRSL